MTGRVRMTIEFLDGDRPSIEVEAAGVAMVSERGYLRRFGRGGVAKYEPNGHYRHQVLLWDGCASYDEFRGEVNEPFSLQEIGDHGE